MSSTLIAESKERAEFCEHFAETASSPDTRETMRYLALGWRMLASEAEAKASKAANAQVLPALQ